jgi:hypothetical protein
MPTLPDDKIKEIATGVAFSNSMAVLSVQTSATIDSDGVPAVEIKFELTPGSTSAVVGLPSALTTSQLIQKLADEGEERLPIVRFEDRGATSSS